MLDIMLFTLLKFHCDLQFIIISTGCIFSVMFHHLSVSLSCDSIVMSRFVPGKPIKVKVPVVFSNADMSFGVKKGGYAFAMIYL